MQKTTQYSWFCHKLCTSLHLVTEALYIAHKKSKKVLQCKSCSTSIAWRPACYIPIIVVFWYFACEKQSRIFVLLQSYPYCGSHMKQPNISGKVQNKRKKVNCLYNKCTRKTIHWRRSHSEVLFMLRFNGVHQKKQRMGISRIRNTCTLSPEQF